ncbi:MAG TPA: GNAT family N-acetyltransferase [Blastococcus sp.]
MTARAFEVDPRDDARWLELSAGPRGSLFTSPPWIAAVCDTYGFEPSARITLDPGGRPTGGLAWVDVDDLRGQRRLALPFCDRADPLLEDVTAWPALAADALAGDLPFTLRALDGSPAGDDPRLTVTAEATWHETALERSTDDLFAAFRPQTRRNIATAERSGVRVVLDPDESGIEEYHRMHVRLRKHKYRLLAQPPDFFHGIWKAFAPADGIRTALALVDGRPVAGAVYLVWGDTVYYKFGASEAEHLSLRPNDALHWALMQWAVDRGLRALDWGLSDLDQPGLIAYKRKWAAVERRIRTLNAGGAPRGRREDVETALRSMTSLLTDPAVPDHITERGGAALYRFFC